MYSKYTDKKTKSVEADEDEMDYEKLELSEMMDIVDNSELVPMQY